MHRLTLSIIIRSTIFWIIVVFSAFLVSIAAVIVLGFNVKLRHKVTTSWSYFFDYFLKVLCGVNYRVTGLENLPKAPCIMASNHQSMWETVIFNIIFPAHVWIMKKELLRVPLFGWTIGTLAPIAINRNDGSGAMAQILTQGADRIKTGFWIMLYPQGTRVAPGGNVAFKIGVGKMSKNLNLPVVPISHNAGYVLPKHSFWIYPGTVTIIVAKPVYPTPEDTPEIITTKLEDIVKANLTTILHKNHA